MNINEKAAQYLRAVATGGDVPGGIRFQKALAQARLDDSLDSLDRISALLRQIHARTNPSQEDIVPGGDFHNFVLVLAFYLGELVSQQVKQPLVWYAYDDALQALPADYGLPRAPFSEIVGIVGGRVLLPLGWIFDHMLSDAPATSGRKYVEDFIAKLTAQRHKDLNQWCRDYLQRFGQGERIPGGLAFRDELQALRLDYSIASLTRVDRLLFELRPKIDVDFGTFISRQDTGNFVLLLTFYLGTTIARSGDIWIKWLEFEETKALIPEIERGIDTENGCRLGDRLYFPAGLILESLFAEQPDRSCVTYAKEIIASNKSISPPPIKKPRGARDERPPPYPALLPVWREALTQGGFLSANGMFMVEDGTPHAPTLLQPKENNGIQVVRLMDDGGAGIDRGLQLLEQNPGNLPFQALLYDGYANLPTGRTDALVLELRTYHMQRLTLSVILPYRNARQPGGFAIFPPRLMNCSIQGSSLPQVLDCYYRGIYSFKVDTFDWDKYLDEGA